MMSAGGRAMAPVNALPKTTRRERGDNVLLEATRMAA
jgi:hypothetical protein